PDRCVAERPSRRGRERGEPGPPAASRAQARNRRVGHLAACRGSDPRLPAAGERPRRGSDRRADRSTAGLPRVTPEPPGSDAAIHDPASDYAAGRHGPEPRGSAMVELRGVVKRFGTHEVLRQLNLTVRTGEKVVIIGASGSGKSTLLRCVNGLEAIQAGTIVVDGIRLGAR